MDQAALLSYAREAADFSTNHQLPALDFAINHYGQPDVAMFDFTCMYASENAAMVRQRHGHKLLVALVGDSLLEVREGKLPMRLCCTVLHLRNCSWRDSSMPCFVFVFFLSLVLLWPYLVIECAVELCLQPFWPMGTGIARGFLAAMDSGWMVKSWAQGKTPLEVLAER